MKCDLQVLLLSYNTCWLLSYQNSFMTFSDFYSNLIERKKGYKNLYCLAYAIVWWFYVSIIKQYIFLAHFEKRIRLTHYIEWLEGGWGEKMLMIVCDGRDMRCKIRKNLLLLYTMNEKHRCELLKLNWVRKKEVKMDKKYSWNGLKEKIFKWNKKNDNPCVCEDWWWRSKDKKLFQVSRIQFLSLSLLRAKKNEAKEIETD